MINKYDERNICEGHSIKQNEPNFEGNTIVFYQ